MNLVDSLFMKLIHFCSAAFCVACDFIDFVEIMYLYETIQVSLYHQGINPIHMCNLQNWKKSVYPILDLSVEQDLHGWSTPSHDTLPWVAAFNCQIKAGKEPWWGHIGIIGEPACLDFGDAVITLYVNLVDYLE